MKPAVCQKKIFDYLFLLALQRFIHYQLRRIAFILYHLGTTSGRRGMYDSLRDRKGPLSLPCSRRIWRSVHSRLQKFVAIIFLLLFEGHLTADPETGPSLGLELIEVFLHWRHHGFRVQGFDWSGLVRPGTTSKHLFFVTAILSTVPFLASQD